MQAHTPFIPTHTGVAVPDTARPPRPYRFGEEPFLLLWQRPSNPVEPHFQHNVAVPSTPDRRNDHRVIFRVGFFNSANETGNMVCHDFSDVTKVYVVNNQIIILYADFAANTNLVFARLA